MSVVLLLPLWLSSQPMPMPPALPVVTGDILPGEGWVPGLHKLKEPVGVFDTWKKGRRLIWRASPGTAYSLISGLLEIRRPDLIILTASIPELGLNAGNRILRHGERGEGSADFWVYRVGAPGIWRLCGMLTAAVAGQAQRTRRLSSSMERKHAGFRSGWRMDETGGRLLLEV